jgi:uncharacterized protein YidB (DUF937 family)
MCQGKKEQKEARMGAFDDAVKDAVPGGNLAKPIMIALGALLLRNMFSKGEAASVPAQAPTTSPASKPDGDVIGGLGGLVEKFQKAGHGQTVDSWIGKVPNQPIQPGQLGSTLGQQTVSDLARQAGVSEQELLSALAQALPGVIDKLTPRGRLPT